MANAPVTANEQVIVGVAAPALPARAWRNTRNFVRAKPLAAFGAAIIVMVVVVAVFANFIATDDPNRVNPVARLQNPSGDAYLGTDNLGRDIFSRVVYGARITVIISITAVIIATTLGTALGGLAGYLGGKTDWLSQRVVDVMLAFPPLVLLLSVVQLLPEPSGGLGIGPLSLDSSMQKAGYIVITLGVLLSFGIARVIRSAVLTIKAGMYVESAKAIGASDARVFIHHVLPNVAPVILTIATSLLGAAILIEASISFLGVGLPPDIPSWGIMLSEGRAFIQTSFNITFWPGLAIALTVFGFNMFGDGLRDVLDPRLRGSR